MNKRIEKSTWKEAVEFASKHRTDYLDVSDDVIRIGRPEEMNEDDRSRLISYVQEFIPWRKGPYELFGHRIDGAWKSHMKWDRVRKYIDDPSGLLVADVGANNGYYMFRMLDLNPQRIIGFDPVPKVHMAFEFLKAFHPDVPLEYHRESFTALENYENTFDIILCMGIVYHHTDPIHILKTCRKALKPGGQLVLESMGIPTTGLVKKEYQEFSHRIRLMEDRKADLAGEPDSVCIFPSGKYAGANGIWFLPTPQALSNFVKRSGFSDVSVMDSHRYEDEQHQTKYSLMPPLSDFLDPENPNRTIEGYPAPVRIHISARR